MPAPKRPLSPKVAFVVLTAFATVVTLTAQWAFGFSAAWAAPVAQALGLSAAWIAAWPLWFKHQPARRFGFVGHSAIMLAIAGTTAAARIVLHLE